MAQSFIEGRGFRMANVLVPYNKIAPVVQRKVEQDFLSTFDCTCTSIQLNEMEQKTIAFSYNNGMHLMAAELIWRRTIAVLRDRLSVFGEEFIGDMLGYDRPVYSDDLTEIEAISLNYDVGFIRANEKMELIHNSEQIKEYTSRQYQMVENITMSKHDALALIDHCIEYVLSDMTESTLLEFNNIRNRLKTELMSDTSEFINGLKSSQYFAKRTILRSLMNLARMENDSEKSVLYHNMDVIIPIIWESLSEADKYSFGTTYAEISNSEKKEYIKVVRKILYTVHGFDYVPENLKSNTFIATAKNLINIHNGYNNYYNEPLAAKLLSSMGTIIPDPAVFECINAVLICITGNRYGISVGAQSYLQKTLDGMTTNKWELYLKDLHMNSELMYQLGFVGGNVVSNWCDVVNVRKLNKITTSNDWTNRFLKASAEMDIDEVKKQAKKQYRNLQKK